MKATSVVTKKIEEKSGNINIYQTKSSSSDLVTSIDHWSEKEIIKLIKELRPNDQILAEEGTQISGKSNVKWIIDPIDGTTNFVYGHPGFSVSVGAEINNETAAGSISVPLLGENFKADTKNGAYRNNQPIQVNNSKNLDTSLISTGFSYDPVKRKKQAEGLTHIIPKIRDIRRTGGAAFDLASVACGRVDGFFESGLSPWDISAGHALVNSAGGKIMTITPPNKNSSKSPKIETMKSATEVSEDMITVAASKELIEKLVELIVESQFYNNKNNLNKNKLL